MNRSLLMGKGGRLENAMPKHKRGEEMRLIYGRNGVER